MFHAMYFKLYLYLFSSGGWNNNPTAAQFLATYRHMLHRCGVRPSTTGNVTALDPTSVLSVGHADVTISRDEAETPDTPSDDADELVLDVLADHDSRPRLSDVVGNVTCYVTGFVVRKALATVKCATCAEAMTSKEVPSDLAELYHLLRMKNRGGLMVPSSGAVKIVMTAEEELRYRSARLDSVHKAVGRRALEAAVLARIGTDDVLCLGRHALDTQYGLDNHHTSMVRLLVSLYHRVRLHHQARLHTARLQRNSLRQRLTKAIIFSGH